MNYLTLLMLFIVNLQLADITMNCSPSDFPFIFLPVLLSLILEHLIGRPAPTEQPFKCRHSARRQKKLFEPDYSRDKVHIIGQERGEERRGKTLAICLAD